MILTILAIEAHANSGKTRIRDKLSMGPTCQSLRGAPPGSHPSPKNGGRRRTVLPARRLLGQLIFFLLRIRDLLRRDDQLVEPGVRRRINSVRVLVGVVRQ